MYLNFSGTNLGGGGTSLGPKTRTSVGWGGLAKFLPDGGTPQSPPGKKKPWNRQFIFASSSWNIYRIIMHTFLFHSLQFFSFFISNVSISFSPFIILSFLPSHLSLSSLYLFLHFLLSSLYSSLSLCLWWYAKNSQSGVGCFINRQFIFA